MREEKENYGNSPSSSSSIAFQLWSFYYHCTVKKKEKPIYLWLIESTELQFMRAFMRSCELVKFPLLLCIATRISLHAVMRFLFDTLHDYHVCSILIFSLLLFYYFSSFLFIRPLTVYSARKKCRAYFYSL